MFPARSRCPVLVLLVCSPLHFALITVVDPKSHMPGPSSRPGDQSNCRQAVTCVEKKKDRVFMGNRVPL